MINGQLVVVSFELREGVAYNMVFSFLFLLALKAGIILENMMLTSERLGEVFPLEAMVPLQAMQAPLVSMGVPGAFQAMQSP